MTVKTKAFFSLLFAILLAALYAAPVLSEMRPIARQGEQFSLLGTPSPLLGKSAMSATVPAPTVPAPTPTATLPRPMTVRFEGVLADIANSGPGLWRIDEISFIVTPLTLLLPADHTPAVGDYATVDATRNLDGTFTALRLLVRVDDISRPVEFRGIITSHPAAPYIGTWQIGAVAVEVKERAVVAGRPRQNDYAQVRGWLRRDHSVEATSITILNTADVIAGVSFEGPIEGMAADDEGYWVIAGVRGLVTVATEIVGTPHVGDMARVVGHRIEGNGVIFDQIRILSREEQATHFVGLIETIDVEEGYGYWIVEGTRFRVDEMTFVDESRGRAAPGMWADIVARRIGTGQWYALLIRVERPD
jgi:hypothetical protein